MTVQAKARLQYGSLFIIWLMIFIPMFPSMFQSWISHSNNSHGLLVPLISLYFVVKKRDSIDFEKDGSYFGCALLVLSMLIYLLSYSGGIFFPARLMIPLSLLCLVWSTLGMENLKTVLFPIFFLIFMIPVPDSILNLVSLPLQLIATDISALIIRSASIPVYQEGNLLYFAHAQLEVAEACSGIQSIMALTMLSVILVYISNMKKVKCLILILSAIPIAFAANVMRVSATGIIAHFYGDGIARSFLHDISGIVVFLIGLLALFTLYKILSRSIQI